MAGEEVRIEKREEEGWRKSLRRIARGEFSQTTLQSLAKSLNESLVLCRGFEGHAHITRGRDDNHLDQKQSTAILLMSIQKEFHPRWRGKSA
jgi:hypothetical protein